MKGLVYYGKEDIRYEGIDDPAIIDDRDVIVETKACGICGSDLHVFHADINEIGEGLELPDRFCVGHEAVGEVVATGKSVASHKVGDFVMMSGFVSCGYCRACVRGNSKKCENGGWNVYGFGTGLGGCQSELIRVPGADYNAAQIPEGVTVEQALLLTDNLPTAYCAILNADFRPGRSVAVVGLGPIGLMVVELAIKMGASVVYAIDLVEGRRNAAAALGAVPIDPAIASETLSEVTKGIMVDCVIEAAGSDQSMALALSLPGIDSNVSFLGVNNSMGFKISRQTFVNNVTIRGNFATEITKYWGDLVIMLQAGQIAPQQFITDTVPLSSGSAAYRKFDKEKGHSLKTVMIP